MNDEILMVKRLDQLKEQHRRLDEEIGQYNPVLDEIRIARLKKQKLQLRDQILSLEVEIYPDVPA